MRENGGESPKRFDKVSIGEGDRKKNYFFTKKVEIEREKKDKELEHSRESPLL